MPNRPLSEEVRSPRPGRPGGALRLGGLAFVLLLALGGYTAFWFYVRDQAEDILAAQIAALEARGYQTNWRDVRWHGYPGRVSVTFGEPEILAPSHAGEWSWSAERLRLSLWPWAYQTIYADAAGEHVVRAPGRAITRLRAEGLTGMAAFDASGGLNAARLNSGPAHAEVAGARVAGVDGARLDLRRTEDGNAYEIEASAERPVSRDFAAGAAPARARAEASVAQADVLAAFGSLDAPALAAWADANGALQIDEACLSWEGELQSAALALASAEPAASPALPEGGCFAVEGPALGLSGALALDPVGRWNGDLRLRARDPGDALARLAALGVITADDARQVGAMAQMAAGDGGDMTLPLQIREGALYFLAFPVAELPRAY